MAAALAPASWHAVPTCNSQPTPRRYTAAAAERRRGSGSCAQAGSGARPGKLALRSPRPAQRAAPHSYASGSRHKPSHRPFPPRHSPAAALTLAGTAPALWRWRDIAILGADSRAIGPFRFTVSAAAPVPRPAGPSVARFKSKDHRPAPGPAASGLGSHRAPEARAAARLRPHAQSGLPSSNKKSPGGLSTRISDRAARCGVGPARAPGLFQQRSRNCERRLCPAREARPDSDVEIARTYRIAAATSGCSLTRTFQAGALVQQRVRRASACLTSDRRLAGLGSASTGGFNLALRWSNRGQWRVCRRRPCRS